MLTFDVCGIDVGTGDARAFEEINLGEACQYYRIAKISKRTRTQSKR